MIKHTAGLAMLGTLLAIFAARHANAFDARAALITTPSSPTQVQNSQPLNTATPASPSTVQRVAPIVPIGGAVAPNTTSPGMMQPLRPVVPAGSTAPASTGLPALTPIGKVSAPAASTSATIKNISSAQDLVALLRTQNKQLKAVITELNQRIQKMELDKPFCSDVGTSANKAGVTRSCSPYRCDPVPGTCLQQAASSDDCVAPYLWSDGQCVSPTPPQGDPCQHWYSCL